MVKNVSTYKSFLKVFRRTLLPLGGIPEIPPPKGNPGYATGYITKLTDLLLANTNSNNSLT